MTAGGTARSCPLWVIRDRVEPVTSPAMAEVNSEQHDSAPVFEAGGAICSVSGSIALAFLELQGLLDEAPVARRDDAVAVRWRRMVLRMRRLESGQLDGFAGRRDIGVERGEVALDGGPAARESGAA